jgi:hypothetical protein
LFEFKKNPGPLQSVLVTAVAAASAVLNSDINVFKKKEAISPVKNQEVMQEAQQRDGTRVQRGPRRAPPVYSVPSPCKYGQVFMADPYEVEVKERRVKVHRIRRKSSGCDNALERWVDGQAKLEEQQARKSSGKKVGRQLSGSSIVKKQPYIYDYDLLEGGVKGRRDTRQLSVRNRAIDEITKHVRKEAKLKGPKYIMRNKWEMSDVDCVPAVPDLDVFERRDSNGNLLPHHRSNSDSERSTRRKTRETRKRGDREPRDRYTRAMSEPIGTSTRLDKAYYNIEKELRKHSGRSKSKRHSRGDSDVRKSYRSSSRKIERNAAGSASGTSLESSTRRRRHRHKHHHHHRSSRHHKRSHRRRHETRSDLSIRRTQGGSASALGNSAVFQPDFYPAEPPLNLGIKEIDGKAPPSPSLHAEILEQISKNSNILEAVQRFSKKESHVETPEDSDPPSPPRHRSRTSKRSSRGEPGSKTPEKRSEQPRGCSERQQFADSPTIEMRSPILKDKNCDLSDAKPRNGENEEDSQFRSPISATKDNSPNQPGTPTWLKRTLSAPSGFTDPSNIWSHSPGQKLASPGDFVKSHAREFASAPTKDGMSSFTIREAAICDSAARLGSGISQTRVERSWEDNCVVDLSTKAKAKPLILKKRPQPTPPTCPSNQPNSSNARGDGGASSEPSEEKKGKILDLTRWTDISAIWTDLFYEEPHEDAEGRPLFSFIPVVGYPLFGEDKWAKKAPAPPAEKPPTLETKFAPNWWFT